MSGYDPACCDLCGSAGADELLRVEGRSFTSDSRIVPRDLVKVACRGCGLVRSGSALAADDLERHYVESYTLGSDAERAEPLLPDGDLLVPRSLAFACWLAEAVDCVRGRPPRSLLEIGCGEGRLLERLASYWEVAEAHGVDPSLTAVEAARRRGLDVEPVGFEDVRGDHDLVYAVAVLEHVPSPRRFFARLREALAPGGLLVVAQPSQAKPSSDVYFVDHLWHFADAHLDAFAGTACLRAAAPPRRSRLAPTFSLHTFTAGEGAELPRRPVPSAVRESVALWRAIFDRVDGWLGERGDAPLAVWGVGQTFELLRAYSLLAAAPIELAIEDNPERFAPGRHPFPLVDFEEAARRAPGADVLVTFTPPPSVVSRLRRASLRWFVPIDETPAAGASRGD